MTQRVLIGSQTASAPSLNLRDQPSVVAEEPTLRNAVVMLTGINNKRWRLVTPLILDYTRDTDGSHLVSDSIFLVYGVGQSIAQALSDYRMSLLEYYQIVSNNVTDEATARQLEQVRQYIRPTT